MKVETKTPPKPKARPRARAKPASPKATPAKAEVVRVRRVRGAGFYQAGVTMASSAPDAEKGKAEPSANPKSALELGTVIKAKLKLGVRTDIGNSKVLATVVNGVKGKDGSFVLPKGAFLHGKARVKGDRVFIDFHRATSGNKRIPFKGKAGLAIEEVNTDDKGGKAPGLPSGRALDVKVDG